MMGITAENWGAWVFFVGLAITVAVILWLNSGGNQKLHLKKQQKVGTPLDVPTLVDAVSFLPLPDPPSTPLVGRTGAPDPINPPQHFIDRDDLMKWIGCASFSQAVLLDGVMVHSGFGPPLSYASGKGTPDRNIIRV